MLRYGGVGWGGVITFMLTCAPTSCYARVIFSCACTHTSCYAMVGWGGVITSMLTCTPTSCYARVIFSCACTHTHTHTRHATLWWGGVGWGGVITFMLTCTPTSCYARVIFSCACRHVMLRYGGVGWGGLDIYNIYIYYIYIYILRYPFIDFYICYVSLLKLRICGFLMPFLEGISPLCRKQDICASCKSLKLWCSCIWRLHFFKACHFCKHRLIILRCLIFTFLNMKFDLLKDEICLHDEASWNYMGKRRKINMQMAAEHES